MLDNFLLGAQVAFQPMSLLFIVFGVFWGIIGGALPGITGSISMALLLPFTWGMSPDIAVNTLAGVYVGAQYGSSITSILIRTPGAPASAATVLDGYAMHQKGESARALGISLWTGTIGGLLSVVALILFALPLVEVALAFGPPEYFATALFGLTVVATLSGGNYIRGFISGLFGLALATVGMDPFVGSSRFDFGLVNMLSGLELIAVMVGLFAVSEVLVQARTMSGWEKIRDTKLATKMPSLAEMKRLMPITLLSSAIGIVVGAMPGAGATIASFIAYAEAKRWSKHPEEFGHGSPEGIAAPETANNAVTASAFAPLLALGIPGSGGAAIMLGALMLHGLRPGPMLFSDHPEVVYALFVGMFIANFAMLALGLLTLQAACRIVNVPQPYLLAAIMALVTIGTYSINNSVFDVLVAMVFGVVGYFMTRYKFSPAATVLGLVLGFLVETNLRRSLMISDIGWGIFFTRPISLVMLMVSFVSLVFPFYRDFRDRGKKKSQVTAVVVPTGELT
jgi:putative tricarboxylic transport membrane protein